MDLWGKKETPVEGELLDGAQKPDMMQSMIMSMVAKNPALQEAFQGVMNMLQTYDNRMKHIEETQQEILTLLRGSRVSQNNVTGSGVIADGMHCALCGSHGECLEACPNNPNFKPLQEVPNA